MKIIKIAGVMTFFCGLLWCARPVYADYVLPYPSYMPGNKLYRLSRLADELRRWWLWGDIASFKYHLSLADKYLVEAKTLFDYKQYLLGQDALQRSDKQFRLLPKYVHDAAVHHKNTKIVQAAAGSAADEHVRILVKLKSEVPSSFLWKPEKAGVISLPLAGDIDASISIRQEVQAQTIADK